MFGLPRRGLAPVRIRRSIDPRPSVCGQSRRWRDSWIRTTHRDRTRLAASAARLSAVLAPKALRTARSAVYTASRIVAAKRPRVPSAGQLPFLSVGFARIIGQAETCRFCSRASGLPLRTCVRSPARTGGGTFLASVARPEGTGHARWSRRCRQDHRGSQALSPTVSWGVGRISPPVGNTKRASSRMEAF